MAKRQSKLQQQEAEARKLNEERKARAEKEAAERRAQQAEALEVSERVADWFAVRCSLRLLSIYLQCHVSNVSSHHSLIIINSIHMISNPMSIANIMYECRPNTRSGPRSKRVSSPRLGRRGDRRHLRRSEPGRVWRRPRPGPTPRDCPPSLPPQGRIRPKAKAGRGCSWLLGPSPCPNWKSSRSQHLMMMMMGMGSRRIGRIEKTALRVVVRRMVAMLEEEASLRSRVG